MDFIGKYARLFGTDEIKSSKSLQAIYWILQTGFFLSFSQWIKNDSVTISAAKSGTHLCLPYFQDCGSLYFFEGLPASYGQGNWYIFLSACLLISGIAAWRSKWNLAHFMLLPAFLWKVLYVSVLTYEAQVDFEYFHIPPLFMFLFAHNKLFFLRRAWVLVYLLAATMKFNESWIVGNYFTSLSLGMPWFPNAVVPLISNGVALFEIITPWLLLSRNERLRYGVLAMWLVFHLYSITLVDFRYPLHCTPLLLALFLPRPTEEEMEPRFNRRFSPGWVIMFLILLSGFLPRMIPGNQLYTLQGIKFGVGMFDANHQCLSTEVIEFQDGTTKKNERASHAGMNRCSPYPLYFRLQQRCERRNVKSIQWTFVSSVNGGPFYKMVDVPNACGLEYKPFFRNEWILEPSTGAPIVGFPRKNIHKRKNYSDDPLMYDTPSIELSPLQEFLKRNLNDITAFWWSLWTIVFLFFVSRRLLKSVARVN